MKSFNKNCHFFTIPSIVFVQFRGIYDKDDKVSDLLGSDLKLQFSIGFYLQTNNIAFSKVFTATVSPNSNINLLATSVVVCSLYYSNRQWHASSINYNWLCASEDSSMSIRLRFHQVSRVKIFFCLNIKTI